MDPTPRLASDVKLSLAVTLPRAGEAALLHLHYSLTSHADHHLFVLDILPGYDPATCNFGADLNWTVTSLLERDIVHFFKGIPPLPLDRLVAVRSMPLATQLAPGATLARELALPLPLTEWNPYLGAAPLDAGEQCLVRRALLTVEIVSVTDEGFHAAPSPLGANLCTVGTANTLRDVAALTAEAPLSEMPLYLHTDLFPRPAAGARAKNLTR